MKWMHTKKEGMYMWMIIFERFRSYLKKRKLGKRMEGLKMKKLYWSNPMRYCNPNH